MQLKVKVRELKNITKWTVTNVHTGDLVAAGSHIDADMAEEDAHNFAMKYVTQGQKVLLDVEDEVID